jgi:drug/metabolite transporter (DMT)-like permease
MNVRWVAGTALLGFAANSLLCRAALGNHAIDPLSFTAVRLCSAGVCLALLVRSGPSLWKKLDAIGASSLFIYAICFSVAYISLSAGTGALLLFGAVQVTMFSLSTWFGQPPTWRQIAGMLSAMGGLVVLSFPGLASPPLSAAFLMLLAGVAWGIYSYRGKSKSDPLLVTARNFLACAPFSLLALAVSPEALYASKEGLALAAASGIFASGLGYTLWYKAVPKIPTAHVALLQLSVPIIAALGGVAFLGEVVNLRFAIASGLVLGGIAFGIYSSRLSARLA